MVIIPLSGGNSSLSRWGSAGYIFMVAFMAYAIGKHRIIRPVTALYRTASYLLTGAATGILLLGLLAIVRPMLARYQIPQVPVMSPSALRSAARGRCTAESGAPSTALSRMPTSPMSPICHQCHSAHPDADELRLWSSASLTCSTQRTQASSSSVPRPTVSAAIGNR